MDIEHQINLLEHFSRILPVTVSTLSHEDATWKPNPNDWSILEVVCHLRDEEVEDFRPRVQLTLESPGTDWPPFDPQQVAIDRKYNEQDLDEALQQFLSERNQSLRWLRSLQNIDWSTVYEHRTWGPTPVGRIMSAWTAHDWLHLRQISKRFYQMAERDGNPYDIRYAGEWNSSPL